MSGGAECCIYSACGSARAFVLFLTIFSSPWPFWQLLTGSTTLETTQWTFLQIHDNARPPPTSRVRFRIWACSSRSRSRSISRHCISSSNNNTFNSNSNSCFSSNSRCFWPLLSSIPRLLLHTNSNRTGAGRRISRLHRFTRPFSKMHSNNRRHRPTQGKCLPRPRILTPQTLS